MKRTNEHLRQALRTRRWDQSDLAQRVGVHRVTVSRWINGVLPERYFQRKICCVLGSSREDLGFVREETEGSFPVLYDPFISSASPKIFIGRDTLLPTVKGLLLEREGAQVGVHGIPGVGKTAIALAVAADPKLRSHFAGGILWAELGPQPDITGILHRWGSALGTGGIESVLHHLHEGNRRTLVVLDDVWSLEASHALQEVCGRCAYLATTRFPPIAASFAIQGRAIKISELSEEEGVALVEHLAPGIALYDADVVGALVRSVGALPLALTLAGKHLYREVYTGQPRRLRRALERLAQSEYRLHVSDPSSPVSLQEVIAGSDERLEEQCRHLLRALSLFPAKPNTFSEEAALAMSRAPVERLDMLSDAGLLEINGVGRYYLHPVIADYARLQLQDATISQRFVEYYKNYIEEHRTDMKALRLESQNIFAALEKIYALGDNTAFLQGICLLRDFLFHCDLAEQAQLFLNRVYDTAQRQGDIHTAALCCQHLEMLTQKQGSFILATTS